jgi:hypothetical protein
MPRSFVRVALAAALALPVLGATPAAAHTHVLSAYLFYHQFPKALDPTWVGNAELVFRTDGTLPEINGYPQSRTTIGPASSYLSVISHDLHCYSSTVAVDRHGLAGFGKKTMSVLPGRRVRVQIGHRGRLLDRVFVVQASRQSFFRGVYLGCGADIASRAMYFGTEPNPEVEPERIFFQADAGPYLRDIRWMGWGTEIAVGHGRFVSDCASCGTPEHKPATIIMHGLTPCPAFGGFIYRYAHFSRLYNGHRRTRPVPSGGFC